MRNRVVKMQNRNFDIVTGSNNIDYQQNNPQFQQVPVDFSKIKIGTKFLDDAILELGDLKRANPYLADKTNVLRAIESYDLKAMREISDYFYRTSGIYNRIIRYMAFMYRYDWYITPYKNDEKAKDDKLLEDFHKCLQKLDNFRVKKTLGEIALKVLKNGCYYGYKVEQGNNIVLQELPADYCRSRFNYGNKPAVEFNMKYFDENFRDTNQRIRILKMFPKEFIKGYELYKQGKLPADFMGDTAGWYLLDPTQTVKFTANGEDYPAFVSVIPLILDLDAAQDLDRKRSMQRLLKIVIQKIPLDKNGELIFDPDEVRDLHNNAVQMLSRAIGTDVLTTFADVTVEDMQGTNASVQTDDLERVERQLYNEAGVSQMQFNTDGNIALEKSVLNDEATMYNLLLQFEDFLNELISPFNKNIKKIEYKAQLLTTTIYNYKELAKLYKEQVSLGYSKMLPQIALGQTQSSILANAYFENEILDLVSLFVPPMQSSTMNADAIASMGKNGKNKNQKIEDKKEAGRKELPDDQKSLKTIQNRESMS